jgi:hypothetical protein
LKEYLKKRGEGQRKKLEDGDERLDIIQEIP